MNDPGNIIPIVLAAGQGKRMGGNKALLDLDGTPAIVRVLETASRAGVGPAIVVVGHEGDRVRALLDGMKAGVPPAIITNPEPERGQTSSVQVGLGAVPESAAAVLVWPVDHALVGADDVAALATGAREHSEATVVLPSHGGRTGHPVLLRRSLFAAILALRPDEPLHTVVRGERARTHFVERPTDAALRDLDTPGDLAAARRGSESRSLRP